MNTDSPDPRNTDERLRSYLNGNQPAQERMCAALLPLLGPFSEVKPRRPSGGPDGGRDIEALYQRSWRVWGAVGFKNSAHGIPAHRNWAKHKFQDELQKVVSGEPKPDGFVFFTNVDLPCAVKETLAKDARAAGVQYAEIFDFERLRMQLDNVEGLLVRLQYLDLRMNADEQAALVGRFGDALQRTIADRFENVGEHMERLLFRAECALPLALAELRIVLKSPASATELHDAQCLITIEGLLPNNDLLFLRAVRSPTNVNAGAGGQIDADLWVGSAPDKVTPAGCHIGRTLQSFSVDWSIKLGQGTRPITLGELSGARFYMHATTPLMERIERASLAINRYQLFLSQRGVSHKSTPSKLWIWQGRMQASIQAADWHMAEESPKWWDFVRHTPPRADPDR